VFPQDVSGGRAGMAARVMCVLRSGGEYKPEHVQRLARMVPGLQVLSDVAVPGVPTIPMMSSWPGWWAKMELFRPDIDCDLFYLDLDTSIVGGIADLATVGRTTMLSDFYWPDRLASGVMYLTKLDRRMVWDRWIVNPAAHMARYHRAGDQGFIESVLPEARRWQEDFPGRIVSYKAHVAARGMTGFHDKRSKGNGKVPAGASVICFHGRPRPWDVGA